jgi:hypothetical protein
MGTLRKPKRTNGPDLEQARREISSLPARLLTKLPVETRIIVQATVTKAEFVLTTAPDAPAVVARGARGLPCWLAASEVDAVVLGVETERMFASDLTAVALRKLHDRSFRVTDEHALGGAQLPENRPAMTLGEVLDALDLEIVGIELGPLAPAITESERQPARAA